MTNPQLKGPALALKVAEVMERHSVYDDGGEVMCSVSNREWRPDRGGEAAWEVLEWLAAQQFIGMQTDDGGKRAWLDCRDKGVGLLGPLMRNEPSLAVAVCRAVVELGETA